MPKEFYGESSAEASKHMYNSKKDFANMPPEKVMADYPASFTGVPYNLFDSMYGLDKQAKSNQMQINKDMYDPYGPPGSKPKKGSVNMSSFGKQHGDSTHRNGPHGNSYGK